MKQLAGVLDKIFDKIIYLGGYLTAWLVPVMMVLVFAEVIMRYIFGKPLMIADEFSAYMLVIIAYMGTAITWKERGHVRITALVSFIPARAAAWLRVVTLSIAFIVSIVITQSVVAFVQRSFEVHMKSATWLNTPLQIPHLLMLIGFILLDILILLEIFRAIANIRKGKLAEAAR